MSLTSIDRQDLHSLLSASTPFIRITDTKKETWCRLMKDEKDGRIGPWNFVASFEILSDSTWKRKGEVIYFVTDNRGTLRLVGQSMSKLNGRWKTVPMYSTISKQKLDRKALFHTSSWPAIESGLDSFESPPFIVSALFRSDLEHLCSLAKGSLRGCLSVPETHLKRLSYHVETWICELDHRPAPLWNKDKVPNAFRTA